MKIELIKKIWDAVISDYILDYIVERRFCNNCVILKIDLWNETIKKNERDLISHLERNRSLLKFSNIIVIEKSKKIVKMFLRKENRYNVKLIVGDISNTPLKPKTTDIIIDFSTSDHLNDKEFTNALSEYSRILSTGGLLILMHYNSHYILGFIEKWINSIYNKHYIKISGLAPKKSFHFRRSLKYLIKVSHDNNFRLDNLAFLPFMITDIIPGFLIRLLDVFVKVFNLHNSFKRFVFRNCLNNKLLSMFTVLYLIKKDKILCI